LKSITNPILLVFIGNKLFHLKHTTMSKERDIEILEFNIAKLEDLIFEYHDKDISQKKIDALEAKKIRYEDQLAALLV